MENNTSCFLACVSCSRVMGLLSSSGNSNNDWNDKQHNSSGDFYITQCRKCEIDSDISTVGITYDLSFIKGSSIIRKAKTAITGKAIIAKNKKKVVIYSRYELMTYAPTKYKMVMATGSKRWPTDRDIPGDFL